MHVRALLAIDKMEVPQTWVAKHMLYNPAQFYVTSAVYCVLNNQFAAGASPLGRHQITMKYRAK